MALERPDSLKSSTYNNTFHEENSNDDKLQEKKQLMEFNGTKNSLMRFIAVWKTVQTFIRLVFRAKITDHKTNVVGKDVQ